MTQAELGARAETNQRTVSAIENRRREPSLAVAQRIASVLGATDEELFGAPTPCGCGCGELTLAGYVEGHYRDGLRDYNARLVDAYDQYREEHGLLTTGEFAELAGLAESTLTTAVREKRLEPAERYPGEWPEESRPLLWRGEEAEDVKRKLRRHHRLGCSMNKLAYYAERRARRELEKETERVKCDLCGRNVERLTRYVRRAERERRRTVCSECLPEWVSALMKARRAVDSADPERPFDPAVARAYARALEAGREFERHAFSSWPKAQGRRPRLARNIATEAMFERGFSDAQIRQLIEQVEGVRVNERYVTRLRQEAGIRRRLSPAVTNGACHHPVRFVRSAFSV